VLILPIEVRATTLTTTMKVAPPTLIGCSYRLAATRKRPRATSGVHADGALNGLQAIGLIVVNGE
jgi:hypothetical protein